MVSPIGVALLVAGGLFVTASVPSSAQPSRTSLPTLRLPTGGPIDVVEGSFVGFTGSVNAALVQLLPSGKVVPDLATWTTSTNHLVYTFTIRHTARFSNGHSVTAQDAVFSLKRFIAFSKGPTSPLTYAGLIQGVVPFSSGKTKTLSGIKVLDRYRLQITLTKPAAYFLGALTTFSTVFDPAVVAGKSLGSPRDHFKTNYLDTTCTGNQGAGPFEFVCHDHSSTLHSFYSGHTRKYTLVPNPYYYGRKPRIRLELFGGLGDTSFNSYKAYLAGKLDFTYFIPPAFLNRWKSKSTEYHEFPTLNTIFITPNVHLAPLNDIHCRLAVAYALDRDVLANTISGGQVRATYALVPRGMLGYYAGKDNPHFNPAKARSELARCPSRTIPLELKYFVGAKNLYTAIGTMLSAVGMNVVLKPLPNTEWFTTVTNPLDGSHTQLVQFGWAADYPDPQDYCSVFLRSGAPLNYGGWHNTAYDRLVDTADVNPNRTERAHLYIRAQHLALSQGALITLFNERNWFLTKPYVHGLVASVINPPVPKHSDWANVSVSKH
ncbi:MAG: ABC transporter substrate-binding protein [Chloroflexota bacterium]